MWISGVIAGPVLLYECGTVLAILALFSESKYYAVLVSEMAKFGECAKFVAPKFEFVRSTVAVTLPPVPNGAFGVYVIKLIAPKKNREPSRLDPALISTLVETRRVDMPRAGVYPDSVMRPGPNPNAPASRRRIAGKTCESNIWRRQ